jgi:hypothetical protein
MKIITTHMKVKVATLSVEEYKELFNYALLEMVNIIIASIEGSDEEDEEDF